MNLRHENSSDIDMSLSPVGFLEACEVGASWEGVEGGSRCLISDVCCYFSVEWLHFSCHHKRRRETATEGEAEGDGVAKVRPAEGSPLERMGWTIETKYRPASKLKEACIMVTESWWGGGGGGWGGVCLDTELRTCFTRGPCHNGR